MTIYLFLAYLVIVHYFNLHMSQDAALILFVLWVIAFAVSDSSPTVVTLKPEGKPDQPPGQDGKR